MRVLFLGPPGSRVERRIADDGDDVVAREDRLDAAACDAIGARFLVSFGYRHILRREVLARFADRAINLHIAYLPWNRGAHPNVWSIFEGTPAGVTIHHIDEGVDTGDIIVQRLVAFPEDATLRTSYLQLVRELEALFDETWPAIRAGTAPRTPQRGAGTSHRKADLERLGPVLNAGWDTPIRDVAAAGARA